MLVIRLLFARKWNSSAERFHQNNKYEPTSELAKTNRRYLCYQ